MRATSRASLEAAQERFAGVLAGAGSEATVLGEQLFALVDALDSSASLRRTLSDSASDGDAKAGLVGRLLGGADERTVATAQDLVRARWSHEADLADAAELLATDALLTAAEADGTLLRVETELFRIERALAGAREVRQVLFDDTVHADARVKLVDDLLGGNAAPVTALFARRATAHPRGRRYVATLVRLGDVIAEWRDRRIATVTSAVELTGAQRDRLADLLERAYGRAVQLNTIVDPAILGGVRIQMGPDVVDSTVLSRLADARRRLAS